MLANAVQPPLPDYSNPPVVETVLGIQFDRLSRFRNAHLGTFWQTLDPIMWPTIEDAPPLTSQFERFSGASRWARSVQLQLTQDLSCRMQARNADSTRMIQLQNSRLHLNWIKTAGQPYPRYEVVRNEFRPVVEKFAQIVAKHDLGDFRPNQWEVTYVNQIPAGTVWRTPADWGFFRPLAGMPAIEGVAEAESFGGEWHFVIPGQRGRLHIDWQHGSDATGQEGDSGAVNAIRMTLTARGSIPNGDAAVSMAFDGLDLGRATIVKAFADLMSADANQYWGLSNAH